MLQSFSGIAESSGTIFGKSDTVEFANGTSGGSLFSCYIDTLRLNYGDFAPLA